MALKDLASALSARDPTALMLRRTPADLQASAKILLVYWALWSVRMIDPARLPRVKYWVSNLPADIPARDLVRLAKLRWRIEYDYRELKTTLGLDHPEGRSFTGWHRHVTLVTAAHLFLTEQRPCPKVPARA